jgi:predicted metal-dependent peptidase
LERHWAGAVDRAVVVARTAGDGQGPLPGGVARAFGLDQRPRLDWRTLLWRFLTRTPTDFAAFDRRLVHRGLYLETLESTSVRVHVAIDTSGSVDAAELDAFGGELQALLASYPGIEATLVYADAAVHGPYPLTPGAPLPPPVGGGGTDFRPFFALIDDGDADATTVAVYLTDGHGDFPAAEPAYPVLWVVTPGGLDDEKFPWGTVVRMV